MSKKQREQLVSYLNEQMHEYEWQAELRKNIDPDMAAYCKFEALKFRLKVGELTHTPEKYKELYKEWVKGVVSPEEYANIDNYFEEKYGVPATKEAIA